MLKKRIIPILLWKDTGLVKGKKFNSWRRVGSVLPAIKIFNLRDVDELVLLNIESHENKKKPDLSFIETCLKHCNVPMTVGGGIDTIDYARELLKIGADKLSINTAAYSNIDLINNLSKEFGKQCVVASVDYKKNIDGELKCYSHNGKKETIYNPLEWVSKIEKNGAGEILLTNIDNEGSMNGYDIDLAKILTRKINIPFICSGGAGNSSHICELFLKTNVSAAAVSSMFQFTEQTPNDVKLYLNSKNIKIRKNVKIQ